MKLMRRRTNEPMTKTPFSTATESPSTHKDNPRSSATQRPPRRRPCNGRSGDRQPQSVGQGGLSVKAERTGGQPRPAAASTPAYRAAAACRGGGGRAFRLSGISDDQQPAGPPPGWPPCAVVRGAVVNLTRRRRGRNGRAPCAMARATSVFVCGRYRTQTPVRQRCVTAHRRWAFL